MPTCPRCNKDTDIFVGTQTTPNTNTVTYLYKCENKKCLNKFETVPIKVDNYNEKK